MSLPLAHNTALFKAHNCFRPTRTPTLKQSIAARTPHWQARTSTLCQASTSGNDWENLTRKAQESASGFAQKAQQTAEEIGTKAQKATSQFVESASPTAERLGRQASKKLKETVAAAEVNFQRTAAKVDSQ